MGNVMERSGFGVGNYKYKEIKNIIVQKTIFAEHFTEARELHTKVLVLIGVSILFCLRKVCC